MCFTKMYNSEQRISKDRAEGVLSIFSYLFTPVVSFEKSLIFDKTQMVIHLAKQTTQQQQTENNK